MHIRDDRKALLARTQRLLGQIEAIREVIREGRDEDCYDVLHRMTSARGALDSLIQLFVEGHIREHVVNANNAKSRAEAGEILIKAVRTFLT
jgi:DNA-binding FrmR family transcriptional regulator